jgi:transposase
MRETITMTQAEQQRTIVLTKVLVGELTISEAATLLKRSERQVWRLKSMFERAGPAALVHGNRGRASPRRLADDIRHRIVELAATRYAGVNDSHLADLLAEAEGIRISLVTVRRILRAAGRPRPRRRRPPRHRSRRDRMPQAGLLVQLDGSRHDWLEGRGPWLSLVGAIDDATGVVTGATFREQEDAAGYLIVLRQTLRRHGVPLAVYRDRHTIFELSGALLTLEEQLVDRRAPTQVGRALEELGISSIAARSPQAKGRIERLWGTFQDRLVSELRLAGAGTCRRRKLSYAVIWSATTAASACRRWIRHQPGDHLPLLPGWTRSCASSIAAWWPMTTLCVPARPSCSCRQRPVTAATPASVSRSNCASMAGSRCGTASASC